MAALEAEVARLRQQVTARQPQSKVPWCERCCGAFKDDLMYEEAVRLGEEYRKSQPTPLDDEVPCKRDYICKTYV